MPTTSHPSWPKKSLELLVRRIATGAPSACCRTRLLQSSSATRLEHQQKQRKPRGKAGLTGTDGGCCTKAASGPCRSNTRMLKDRAWRGTGGGSRLTTDEDSRSELETGKYWSKAQRKQRVLLVKEQKQRKELQSQKEQRSEDKASAEHRRNQKKGTTHLPKGSHVPPRAGLLGKEAPSVPAERLPSRLQTSAAPVPTKVLPQKQGAWQSYKLRTPARSCFSTQTQPGSPVLYSSLSQ